jgi:hypothetical protein
MSKPLNKFFLEVSGRSYEFCLEKLSSEQYAYWNEHDEELGDALTGFASDEIPEDAILPNYYSDLDREGGPVVEDCIITVSDQRGNDVFCSPLSNLPCYVATNSSKTESLEERLSKGFYLRIENGDKGSFFTAEFETETFDPKKLTFDSSDVEGVEIVTAVHYDEQELDDTGSWSNTGKYFEVDLIEVKGPLDKLLSSAASFFEAGDVTGAIKYISESISQNIKSRSFSESDILRAQRQIAIYTMHNSDHSKAEKLFKQNLSKWEILEGAYGREYSLTAGYYSANLVEQGKYAAAIPFSHRHLMDFDGAYDWFNLAHALENVGRLRESESAYLRAIEAADNQHNDYVKIHSLHGLYHVLKHDRARKSEAITALDSAIKIARASKHTDLLKILRADYKKIAK